MSHFEYVMVIVSIILGLGLTLVLRGLSKLMRSEHPSVVVVLYGVFLLMTHLQTWWGLWDAREIGQWTQVRFVLVAAYPCILYAMSELMLPMAARPDTDWKAHFLSVRRWYFSLQAMLVVSGSMLTWLMLSVPLLHPYRLVQLGLLLLSLLALTTERMRLQLWIVIGLMTVLTTGQLLFRLLPGLGG